MCIIMAQKLENREAFLKNKDVFRKKAAIIIIKMLDLSKKTGNTMLVKEVLNSIFFLGKISALPFSPAIILRQRENEVRQLYPDLFQGSPQLPKRSPFSCVLEMIVSCFGEGKEEEIKTALQEFILCVCLCPCDISTYPQEISQEVFTRNAMRIIDVMLEPTHPTQKSGKTPALVNQVLHSIFFLGHNKNPRCTPEMILGERRDEVCERYPRPFERYLSEEPIPCVLNTIGHLIGQENIEEITRGCQELILKLKKCTYKKFLLSSTVCVSQVKTQSDSVRYYGVSISTFPDNARPKAREIMIAASCLGYWHEYVAGAVMTYLPNENNKVKMINQNIDGTIELPKDVRCEAFSLTDGVKMFPCESCVTLFSLEKNGKQRGYHYGNCAEVESLSKVLTNETEVGDRVKLKAPKCWTGNARVKIQSYLKSMLDDMKFEWDGQFYSL